MRQLRKLANYFSQLNDLKVWRTVLPVVYPADDEVAAAGIMAMGEEVTALMLKLNAHILPASGFHFQFCAAINERELDDRKHYGKMREGLMRRKSRP